MSVITKIIANADTECRYPTPGEMTQVKDFLMSGDRRLRLIESLTGSRDFIVKEAANQLFRSRPNLISPSGNAYGKEMTATCLRDMDYYLRLITYSVAAGEVTPIQEIGVIGVHQMYRSLGTPIDAVAESVRSMKVVTMSMMSGEDASEISFYFDYLIDSLQ